MNNRIGFYKDVKIFKLILNILKKVVGSECDFMCVSGPGSSPSKIYMFKDNKNHIFAVKLCEKNLSRVSLLKEAKNYKILLPYIKEHLPKIIYTGIVDNYEIMISKSNGVDSLYSSMISNKKTIESYLGLWKEFLLSITNMWSSTIDYNYQTEKNPRNNKNRIKRIKKGVYEVLFSIFKNDNYIYYPVVVNGIEYISLFDTFKIISEVDMPNFGIICHGDPQPSNIVITKDEDWYLVDWEWSGKNHDFRMMFSHLFGWWPTRMISLKKVHDMIIKDKKIFINYDIMCDNEIKLFQNEAYMHVNNVFNINEKDSDDINRFLSLLYLGDIRFLNIWEKYDYLPLLFGEAIKTANYVINKNINSINTAFTFTGRKYEKKKNNR